MSESVKSAIESLKRYPDFKQYPQFVWSRADIAKFEKTTGFRIPVQLDEVFTSYGNVGCAETELYFRANFSDGSEEVAEVQILFNDLEQVLDFHETFISNDDHPGRMEPKYIVFGTADGGNSFLLADGKRDDSPIYYWQLAFDPLGEGDNARGVAKVADSLADFILGLRTIDEI